mmetsp:Transcript_49/g.73  ORF Transcript_49/g.73 Transcript_49/m.73 type:complete len:115 (+) Transcript_49:717-1061(+)
MYDVNLSVIPSEENAFKENGSDFCLYVDDESTFLGYEKKLSHKVWTLTYAIMLLVSIKISWSISARSLQNHDSQPQVDQTCWLQEAMEEECTNSELVKTSIDTIDLFADDAWEY